MPEANLRGIPHEEGLLVLKSDSRRGYLLRFVTPDLALLGTYIHPHRRAAGYSARNIKRANTCRLKLSVAEVLGCDRIARDGHLPA